MLALARVAFKQQTICHGLFSKKMKYCFSNDFVKKYKRSVTEPIETNLKILNIEKINHDCYIYRTSFDGPIFPMSIGQHFRIYSSVQTKEHPEGEEIMRSYTPISSLEEINSKGKVDMLVKIYRPNCHPIYPNGGILTPVLEKMKVGDTVKVAGPFGKFSYDAPGTISISPTVFSEQATQYRIKKLFMIAGGTGITPIYQIFSEVAKNPEDKTEMTLLFCNKTEEDIIMKKDIQMLGSRIKVHYMLEQPKAPWTGLKGRVDPEVLNSIYPLDDPDTCYLSCGPGPKNRKMKEIFSKLYPDSKYHKV